MVRRLGGIAFTLFGTRAYVEERAAEDLDLIGVRDDPRSRQARWLGSFVPQASTSLRLGDVRLRLEAALEGQGVALLPCFMGDSEFRLVRVVPPPEELEEDVFLLVHRDLIELPSVRTLMDALVLLFRQQSAELRGDMSGDGAPTHRPAP